MGLFRKQGQYKGVVVFDGEHFYAVKHKPSGDKVDYNTRLKSVGEEFHYAEKGYPPHNDLHGTNMLELEIGGDE